MLATTIINNNQHGGVRKHPWATFELTRMLRMPMSCWLLGSHNCATHAPLYLPSRGRPGGTISTRAASHWGQGPKYPLGTLWTHWEHRQHVTPMCPVIKCWVHFKCTPLCDPDMPSGYILSTFWMCPAMWLQFTQWAKNWAYFECSARCDHNVPSGQMVNIFKISFSDKS